jgi:hypothetical protein
MRNKLLLYFRSFKNYLIVFLIALALYQTAQLWFVSIANRNVFSDYFLSLVSPSLPDGYGSITQPFRIVSGSGSGRFDIQYSGLKEAESKAYADAVLTAILKSGEFVGSYIADYADLLSGPVYIYEYAFPMTADIFAPAYGQRANVLTARGVSVFTAAVICPPTAKDESVRVFFINAGNAAEYVLSKSNRQEPAARYIHEVPPASGGFYYVSMSLNGSETAAPLIFIPHWESGPLYRPVTVTNPYANNFGEKLIYHIQSRVEPFFDYPAAINAALDADAVYTFSSMNMVVRYHNRDILEYASFRAVDGGGTSNFITDYSAALSFVDADGYVVNEVYLSDFIVNNGRHMFFFDYVINDMPLVLPAGWPSPAENGHVIEVTVDRGTVVRYKKLVYNFHIDENAAQAGWVDFNRAYAELDDKDITQVLLGYKISDTRRLSLYWFLESGGGWLSRSLGD